MVGRPRVPGIREGKIREALESMNVSSLGNTIETLVSKTKGREERDRLSSWIVLRIEQIIHRKHFSKVPGGGAIQLFNIILVCINITQVSTHYLQRGW